MSDTIHKQTVIDLVERDIENKYAFIKQNALKLISSLSSSIPLLKVALPSANQWISGKEKQFLPHVQSMVNMCVESSFAEPEITVEDAYANCKLLFNEGIDEMIKQKSQFSLESIDQVAQVLIGTKISI